MVAALPVNDQFQIVADDVDNDLGYDGANDLLARLRGGAATGPRSRQILTERHKSLAVRVGQCWPFISIEAIDLDSSSRTATRRSFQRRSSSPATRRFSGSAA